MFGFGINYGFNIGFPSQYGYGLPLLCNYNYFYNPLALFQYSPSWYTLNTRIYNPIPNYFVDFGVPYYKSTPNFNSSPSWDITSQYLVTPSNFSAAEMCKNASNEYSKRNDEKKTETVSIPNATDVFSGYNEIAGKRLAKIAYDSVDIPHNQCSDYVNSAISKAELGNYTKLDANVVKPIEVKNNVYVMEKATGVSLKSFLDLNWLHVAKEGIAKGENILKIIGVKEQTEAKIKNSYGVRFTKWSINRYLDWKIKKVLNKMPGFESVKFDKNDTSYLLREYQKVFVEQFHKIDRNGKTIHADVHPGNIFINPQALKTQKGKLFTLIDTGNTIDMNIEQSMHALNLTSYVKLGNVKDIAEYVLNGAKLPQGMTKEEALQKIISELNKCFFDDKTKIDLMNADKVLGMTDSIMQKYDIIPSSTQMNLNKSKIAATNALKGLKASLTIYDGIENTLGNDTSKWKASMGLTGIFTKFFMNAKKFDGMVAQQESKNLKQLTPAQRLKQKFNKNAPEKSSEDYITYRLKQLMRGKEIKD